MHEPAHILIVEDDAGVARQLQRVLSEAGHAVERASDGLQGLAFALDRPVDLVLTDLNLPGLSGLDLVRQLHAAKPQLPILVLTGHGTTDTAIEATKFGASDYLLKPPDVSQLLDLVAKASRWRADPGPPLPPDDPGARRCALIGRSAPLLSIYKEIGRVAARPVSVLIRGETGTGKELVARAIHQHSDRAHAPFIDINCAAIPETLLESELFGHERGAFTGAESRHLGCFEQADHGTLFLDEIGDMTPATQIKLVRVLQERRLHRLGGREVIPVDVRVIAATHQDLETAICQRQFREDLYFRLSMVVITLPPLRERREDIPELVRHFLLKHGPELGHPNPCIEPAAVGLLETEAWPGNVRELENVVRQILLLAQGCPIHADHVRLVLSRSAGTAAASRPELGDYVEELLAATCRGEAGGAHRILLQAAERELFTRALARAHGNQARVARWLGLTRVTVRQKLLRFGLHPGPARRAP